MNNSTAQNSGDSNEIFLKSAFVYANRFKIPVFPCRPKGKEPLTPRGFKDATLDQTIISGWAKRWPNANIGGVTGSRSGLIVIDVDQPDGNETIRKLEKLHGALPLTPTSLTGGGGMQYFFKYPGSDIGNRVAIWPCVDIRGENGYAILPPSIHPNGRQYHWEVSAHPAGCALAELPTWIESEIKSPPISAPKPPSFWKQICEKAVCMGNRNDIIAKISGHLLRRYVDTNLTLALLKSFNQTNLTPPLDERELLTILNSIAGCELRRIKKT